MFDHVDFAVSDLERSRHFYSRILAELGIEAFTDVKRDNDREGTGYGSPEGPQFWIGGGEPVSGRMHVAFAAESRAAVDGFYDAAINAGGTCKGPPGLRPQYADGYYAAFVVDPDGHTIEAVCRFDE